ncbi:MAG: tRNA-binding protein [Phycisphaerales bacterium]
MPDPAAFFDVDLRVARITAAEPNPKARVPAYVLTLDLGPLGPRTSSAQLTERYAPAELVGRLVIVAANLGARRIAGVKSQVLVLGASDAAGQTALLGVEPGTPPGSRVH